MTILFTILLHWFTVLPLPISKTTTDSIKITDFTKAFEDLNTLPASFLVTNNISYNAEGGHLQGIQLYKDHTAYLSGSSEDLSYMVKMELGEQSKVVSIDTLMKAPLRHAGGFQIFDQYLAVGIEDNKKRNLAYLQVYNLEAENPFDKPIYTIERKGDYERVTAGAVGITAFQGQVLILVANWDSRVLDFYSCPEQDFYAGKGKFTFKSAIEVKGPSRTKWSDPYWLSYQNLNLFSDQKDQLYMVGTAKNDEGEQVADLFHLQLASSSAKITKINSKVFDTNTSVDFKAAAGLNIAVSGSLILAAAPYHLEKNTTINLFTTSAPKSTTWKTIQEWPSPDARQAAAATEQHVFAINNHSISKYNRSSGELIASKSYPNTKHLNSGFLSEGLLYCAHSNYPNQPDSSSIRLIDPKTLALKQTINLGKSEGSLTWIVKNKGHWYALFAYYGENNHLTYLARMNDNWEILQKWTFPESVIEEMGKMSISGGVAWKEGFLVTGHDEKILYYVTLPKNGEILNFMQQYEAPFTGQGIALDPFTGGLIGINRADKKVIAAQFRP
ncbi:hypothetical protein [Cyclobacterium qasimii]|uniref:Uncharacterized protein n=2 Tax=Cyclobacterium qasimii TaxID=1350429 RepID=S7VBC4_9BACT|nr:hypothetical protein [Cyclobacterium qasimii]EPR66862.1 hypothetical protein ADICYQ_4123 [Cyclobacterium qasimii M12-11B]GEO22908.1 hypothetical protein CQA01_34420 [Cyclobacterium qasimii]